MLVYSPERASKWDAVAELFRAARGMDGRARSRTRERKGIRDKSGNLHGLEARLASAMRADAAFAAKTKQILHFVQDDNRGARPGTSASRRAFG